VSDPCEITNWQAPCVTDEACSDVAAGAGSSFKVVKPPSPALRRLLESKLDTVEKLELVLMLRDAATPLRDAALRLQVGEEVLRRVVDEVVRARLVEVIAPDDQLRLLATADELDAIEEAAQIYSENRGRMTALFSAIALDRLRSMGARAFADAFAFRKKKDRDDG
jgi:hypothetical protein